MTSSTYSFTCPCCKKTYRADKKEDLPKFEFKHSSRTFLVCSNCFGGGIKQDVRTLPENQIVTTTTKVCDCKGCGQSTSFTDEPIASGFPPGYFWTAAKEVDPDRVPGARAVLLKDICPDCTERALAGIKA